MKQESPSIIHEGTQESDMRLGEVTWLSLSLAQQPLCKSRADRSKGDASADIIYLIPVESQSLP